MRGVLAFVGVVSLSLSATGQTVQLPADMPAEMREQLMRQIAGREGQVIAAPGSTQPTTQPTDPKAAFAQRLQQIPFSRQPRQIVAAAATQPAANADPASRFEADVHAGRWQNVAMALQDLGEPHGTAACKHLLRCLTGPQMPQMPAGGQRIVHGPVVSDGSIRVSSSAAAVAAARAGFLNAQNPASARRGASTTALQLGAAGPEGIAGPSFLTTADAIALLDISPTAPDDETVRLLAQLLASATRNAAFEPVLAALRKGTVHFGPSNLSRARTAELLFAAGRSADLGEFLRPIDEARDALDGPSLDQQARYLEAVSTDPKQPGALQTAWDVNQLLIATDTFDPKLREAALQRSLGLLARLKPEQAEAWLKGSFAGIASRGWSALLQSAGSTLPLTPQNDPESRRRVLEQNFRLGEAVLSARPDDGASFGVALNVMSAAWIAEAELTRSRPRPQINRNMMASGNYVYINGIAYDPYTAAQMQQQQDPNQPQPIPADALLKVAPSPLWLKQVDAGLAPRAAALTASLRLAAEDVTGALGVIESIAADSPKAAEPLASELLQAWARIANPNPNQNNPYQNQQMVYYSGGMMMNPTMGIPLTRAQQAKNLADLAGIVGRLRKLQGVKLADGDLAQAFAAAHSAAEVYRLEDIEALFGPAEEIPSDSLDAILGAMRSRLGGQWRNAQLQQQNKTNRSDKDLNAEIRRGYDVVDQLVAARLQREPDNWKLLTLRGMALFDRAEFDFGKGEPLAQYTTRRDAAFASFSRAAAAYASQVLSLEENLRSFLVYRAWFSAALGASDLGFLTRQSQPQPGMIEQIRAAIGSLPGDQAQKHLELFATGLDEAIPTLRPEIKQRYLRAGLQVVGDQAEARESRKLVAYYDQLLGEVQLHVEVDGPTGVGSGKPFGVIVGVRHSDAVGRESGGFARLLQNQGQIRYFYNPTGQAPVNHRDEMEKRIRQALVDRFDILSVSFAEDKVEPRGFGRPGWRFTPLAYAMLKARDAAVDRIPAIQYDMDFFDRFGQVLLPIESQVVLIDARESSPRPMEALAITQTLDQREAKTGKLVLDIKATARGVIPPIDQLLDVNVTGFHADSVDDQGLTVSGFSTDTDTLAPTCERSWLITLSPPQDRATPTSFRYATARVEPVDMTYRKYADADVQNVDASIAVAGLPLRSRPVWPWVAGGAGGIAGLLVAWRWLTRRTPAPAAQAVDYRLPGTITPFTVVQLLRRIHTEASARLSDDRKTELVQVIAGLEKQYFSPQSNGQGNGDLRTLAQRWVSAANHG